VVDRVDLEPASIGGYRLRVYLSALTLQGQLLDLSDPKTIRLYLGSSEKKIPFSLGTYDATNSDTDIVFVVQATADFADALPLISDSIERELLAKIPDHVKVAVVPYGESTGAPKLVAAKLLRGKVSLASDQSTGDPTLLDAIDRALMVLKKASAPVPSATEGAPPVPARPQRKMIVVIGDGRDALGDHERVTRTGIRAAKEGVRIHALAYSPPDLRRTLLALGELSRKSLGTFRWPGQGRKPIGETWNDSFKQLAAEINKQYVVTFYANAEDDVAGKKLHLVLAGRTEATSNELKVPAAPTCAGAPCETGYCANDTCLVAKEASGTGAAIVKWLLVIGGIVVGAIVLLGFIGWLMQRRQASAMQPPMHGDPAHPMAVPSMPPRGPQAGLLANGRPIPALIMMTGPRAGERILLRNGFSVGKQPGSDLVIEDGYTSSQHAQFTMDPQGNCVLYDLGSTNGTFVNGARIQTSALAHGVTIKIGSIEMRFLTQ
jgi:hypothetical protein